MTRKFTLLAIVVLAVLLAACSATPSTEATKPGPGESLSPGNGAITSPAPQADASADLARTDEQGSVGFVITPLNLASPGETLDFDVTMDTHSVDLSWDLAAQSTLRTDTSVEVKGLNWPAGGGHHYEGTLTFPATSADGKSVLEGASRLTLTIQGTDVPTRVFEWDLIQ